MSLSFSEHAEKQMWDLLKSYDSQVGSQYTGSDGAGKTKTDCITYVMRALAYAYEQTGQPDKASSVRSYSKKGTDLAQFLVTSSWKAYYWNPDVRVPRDGLSEHPFAYQTTKKTGSYYSVSVSGYIINYNLTRSSGGGCSGSDTRGPNDMVAFDKFSKVRFAYGLAKGGMHTFLLSYGMVYEVHWDKIGKDLYARNPFYFYEWLDGLVVTPPDSGFSVQ